MKTKGLLLAFMLFIGICLNGCGVSEQKLISEINALKTQIAEQKISYTLNEVKVDQEVTGVQEVAKIISTVTITKGDRISVGDDMWEVTGTKMLAVKYPDIGDTKSQYHNISHIELIVSFAGKATTPTLKENIKQ